MKAGVFVGKGGEIVTKKFLLVLMSCNSFQLYKAGFRLYTPKRVFELLVVRMSAFLLALQTVVHKTILVWPSPKAHLPVQIFEKVKEQDMQVGSGMASQA